jgi:hypothetical protein
MTFAEYVAFYGLARSEGLVLRYLSDAYKALRQTVPESARTDELSDIVEWLGELVRQTDSSLLDEWEALVDPDRPETVETAHTAMVAAETRPITRNTRAFGVLVRNAMFRRVELLARRAYDELGELDAAGGMDAAVWREAAAEYYDEHAHLDIGPDARGPAMFLVEKQPDRWLVQQILGDPEGNHDWRIFGEADLAASDQAGELVLQVTGLRQA